MKQFKINRLKLRSGEEIGIIETSKGEFVCPVCGYLWPGDEPPYFNYTKEFASATHNICPSCHTHFGFDDYVEEGSVKECWKQLRTAWLQRVGESSAGARDQLKNLESNQP
jgi:transposase-like protein